MYRKLFNLRVLFFFLLFSTMLVQAQEDSIVVETQTSSDESYYKLKYESLDMFLRDETRLFKIAISPFKPNEKYDFSIVLTQLSYESKLGKAWSGLAELNQELMLLSHGTVLINSFDLGVRHYINKSKQIQQGLSGNNCNGVYAGAKASGLVRATTRFAENAQDRYISLIPSPELNIGIQQRISNFFYVDANAFVNYNFQLSEPGFGIKILIGLAISAGE
ncbi:MAG: hypothetical protein Q7J05_06765 [Paludibacter sp.]|nr:hypothetical protein [Paludibacter sp.]